MRSKFRVDANLRVRPLGDLRHRKPGLIILVQDLDLVGKFKVLEVAALAIERLFDAHLTLLYGQISSGILELYLVQMIDDAIEQLYLSAEAVVLVLVRHHDDDRPKLLVSFKFTSLKAEVVGELPQADGT